MNLLQRWRHIRRRRRDLEEIDVSASFPAWEESCVPSYLHPNPLAAWVSWARLFAAVGLARRNAPGPRRALDFGASVGELGHLLPDGCEYAFIERDAHAASFLRSRHPEAVATTLDEASDVYDWVFAVDALEHNEGYAELVGRLADRLAEGGALILSGPTENALYRLGRRLSGFEGGYHVTTIAEIERATAGRLRRRDSRTLYPGLPLFRLSVWSR